MIYQPFPIGRVCHICNTWYPRADLVKNKRVQVGVTSTCLNCAKSKNDAWAHSHPEKVRASRQRWEKANPGKTEIAIKNWVKRNPDKVREIGKRTAKNNPEKARAKVQLRNARKKALPHTFSLNDWQYALEYWNNRCAYCGNTPNPSQKTKVLVQEHFYPLVHGGPYTKSNILPACKSCNSQKQNFDPVEWIINHFGETESVNILARIHTYFDLIEVLHGSD